MKKTEIIEIQALDNGAHRNQIWIGEIALPGSLTTILNHDRSGKIVLPEGWAVIPEDVEKPASFPFVDLTVEEVTHYETVSYLREKTVVNEDGEEITTQEEVTEEVPYTVPTVTGMTEREMPVPEEPAQTSTPTVWDELDAAYQEGVDSV